MTKARFASRGNFMIMLYLIILIKKQTVLLMINNTDVFMLASQGP